jgi:uncharacterized membrane protein YkvA (DUF1232 family)
MKHPALVSALIGLGALLYGASPFDLVPEILAGPLGFGDDAIVLVAAGVAIWRILKNRRTGEPPSPQQPPSTEQPPFMQQPPVPPAA